MRFTRLLVLMSVAAALAMLVGAAVQAEEPQPATGASRIVNLDMKDTPIKDAIGSIFQGSGLKYYIRPGVSGRVVEMKLTGVTVEQAINALVEAAQLTVKVEDGAYIIAPGPKSRGSRSAAAKSPRAPAEPAQPQEEQSGAGPSGEPGAQPGPAEPKGTVQTQGGSSANVVISQPPSPVYYGQPGYGQPGGAYSDPYAYDPYYNPSAYPPMYQYGNVRFMGGYSPVVIAGGNPTLLQRGRLVPPPAGYVGPDLLRFLRTQWAIQNRTYITYPYYPYPY